jgi:hypothetical protein
VFHVHRKIPLGEIFNMTEGSFDYKLLAQVFVAGDSTITRAFGIFYFRISGDLAASKKSRHFAASMQLRYSPHQP